MILIDTNVISELWKPGPDSNLLAWIDAQTIEPKNSSYPVAGRASGDLNGPSVGAIFSLT